MVLLCLSPLFPFLPHWPHILQPFSCGHIGVSFAGPQLGLPGSPQFPGGWLEEGTVLRPRELHAVRGWHRCALTRFTLSEMLMMASISSSHCKAQELNECPGVMHAKDPRVWG